MKVEEKDFKRLRTSFGTQDEIAKLLGVSQQSVAKWESGKSYPRTKTIRNLSLLFGVSADEILTAIDNSTNK